MGKAAGISQTFTYYVDNFGNDSNNGLTPGAAFQTISKVNSMLLLPGQSVGFKSGGIWRESLSIKTAGRALAPITYGSYGSGPQPIISGAELSNWTRVVSSGGQAGAPSSGFSSGFETPNFTDWDGTDFQGNPTLVATTKKPASGLFSMQFTGDGRDNRGCVYKYLPAMTIGSTSYFRLSIFTPSGSLGPNNTLKYLEFYSGATPFGFGSLNTDGNGNIASFTLAMFSGGGAPISNVGIAGNYHMDQWNTVEIGYKTHPSAGSMQVWVNGQAMGSVTAINTGGGIGLNRIQVGNGNYGSIVSKGASIYFDDVTVSPSGSGGQVTLASAPASGAAQELAPTGGFASGFEAPNFADWDFTHVSGGNPSLGVTATNPAHGLFCMQFTGDGSINMGAVGKNISAMAPGTSRYFRLYIRTASGSLAPNNALKYITFYAGPNQVGYAALNTDSFGAVASFTLNMYTGGGYPIANVSLAGKYLMSQWNQIEIEYKTDSQAGSMQVWVNGQSIGLAQSLNTSGAVGLNQIRVGNDNWGSIVTRGASIYFDDVVVSPTGPVGSYSGGNVPAIWQANQTSNPWYPSYTSLPGQQVSSLSALQTAGQWYWDGVSTLSLCSPYDPASLVEIPARKYAVTLSAASFITLSNLNFRGAQISGLFASGGCNHVTLTGCTLELNWENGGIFIDGNAYQSNGVVQNCVLRSNGGSGWNTNGYFAQWLFDGNQAYLNGQILSGSIDHDFSAGIKLFSISGTDGAGTVLQNNVSYSNGLAGGNGGQGVGLWADTCKGVTFKSNTVHNNNGWGLYVENNFSSVACYNLCYNNATAAYSANLGCSVSDGNNASNNQIFNNTCWGGWWGMYCGAYEGNGHSTISSQIWQNNIAIGSRYQNLYVGPGGNNDGVNGSGNVYAYNCLGAAATNFVMWVNSGALSSYAALDSCCGAPSHNVQGDPVLTSVAAGSFTLKPGSPCIGTGVQIPGYTAANPNIGAF